MSVSDNIIQDTVPYLMINENADKDNSFAYNLFVRFGNWFLLLK